MVQVTITGRHTDVPDSFKEYAQEKLEKLPRVFDKVMGIEVVIEGGNSPNSVEIVVSAARHREFVAKETGDDTYACFDLAIDKIERQLRRHKEKIRNRKHPEQQESQG